MNISDTINKFFRNITINELKGMNKTFLNPDITYNSLLYLDIISYTPNCTVSYIAQALNISKSAVTIKANELVKQGLITRTQSTTDKRVFYLNMNEEIAKPYETYDKSMDKAIDYIQQRFTENEIETFCVILETIENKYLEGFKHE